MNCKPGDLAYVTSGARTAGLDGRFVIVGEPNPIGRVTVDGVIFECPTHGFTCTAADGGTLPTLLSGHVKRRPIAAAILRPIRDPGDDAQDETLQWLPVPSK
jgi:hypothetical protein